MPPLRFFHRLIGAAEEPAPVYYIRGTSTNVNGTETFNIQFIDDGALRPSAAETITCAVDGNGNWEYTYSGKTIYSINETFMIKTSITSIELTESLHNCVDCDFAFGGMTNVTAILLPNALLDNVLTIRNMLVNTPNLLTLQMPLATFENAVDSYVSGVYNFIANTGAPTISLPAATFAKLTNITSLFDSCSNTTLIELPSATFASVITATSLCRNCNANLVLKMPAATFASLTATVDMFKGGGLKELDISGATFANITDMRAMFANCSNLQDIKWSNNLTLSNVTTIGDIGSSKGGIFQSCEKLKDSAIAAFGNQSFDALTSMINAFYACKALTTIDLHSATMPNLASAWAAFGDCTSLIELNMSNATFASMTLATYAQNYHMLSNCKALTTFNVPQNSTAMVPNANPSNTQLWSAASPLNYASMLKMANWVCSCVGYQAKTMTFKASAWNALSSAEQTNIDTILSGKNWNRAIA